MRYAGQEGTTLLNGTFEVISLNGTLEQSGEHLHLCVSDPHGTMLGGHMMPGCTVRTTLELVIGSLEELAFSRQPCALSGYDELHISPLNNYFQRGFLMARSHFSSQALVLIVISIAINMIGGQLASMVKLPIFLDSIGTLISAVLLGPVIGMLTGLLTNLLWGLLTDPIAAAFAPSRWSSARRRLAGASGLVSHPAKSRCQRRDYYACGNGRRCTAAYCAVRRCHR